MKILGLDISTHTGWALLENGVLSLYDTFHVKADFKNKHDIIRDVNFLKTAMLISSKIIEIIKKTTPDKIYIEQTNKGKSRISQKLLEFIHFSVLQKLINIKKISIVDYIDSSQWRKILQIKMSKEDRKRNKLVKSKSARGKITSKHLSVRWANNTYNLNLKLKDNDIADAIAVATAGYMKEGE